MMADELSRWRQPGWGNYKRASKPPPAATKGGKREKKKSGHCSSCLLRRIARSTGASLPCRQTVVCVRRIRWAFSESSKATRGLYRSRSASPGFSRRQPAIRSTAPLGRWGRPEEARQAGVPCSLLTPMIQLSAGLQLAFLQALSH